MKVSLYTGNLFLLPSGPTEAAVVTTNGMLKSNGDLVMGKGIARYCRDEHAGIATVLGKLVREHGNKPFFAGVYTDRHRAASGLDPRVSVLSCPTKNDWRRDSDPELIARSCRELVRIANEIGLTTVYLPALGCSAGRLDWNTQVLPLISPILDDRFVAAIDPAVV